MDLHILSRPDTAALRDIWRYFFYDIYKHYISIFSDTSSEAISVFSGPVKSHNSGKFAQFSTKPVIDHSRQANEALANI